ncbi:MAG: hypothetical protein FJZ01_16100 [Candidatus Sericytochromatia bacterium]|nr:hypothetical protein [Candidatus Tanganyikabacteria bacterium]
MPTPISGQRFARIILFTYLASAAWVFASTSPSFSWPGSGHLSAPDHRSLAAAGVAVLVMLALRRLRPVRLLPLAPCDAGRREEV